MTDLDPKMMKNLPYFDFEEAIENYGFDFELFSQDGFARLISEIFIDNFIEFRKAFLCRDFNKLRFFVHKFKGSFL